MAKTVVKKEVEAVQVGIETPVEKVQVEVKKEIPVEVKQKEIKVVNIIQKLPSGYRLLLETGEVVKVTKAQYTKGQTTIIL